MPTLEDKTYSSYYKNIVTIDQNTNTGIDASPKRLQDGAGNNISVSASDDVLKVQPNSDDSAETFLVNDQGGDSILTVDTTNSVVKAGSSQINALTMFKEMGLYEFSPNSAGYHYPLIANTMFSQGTEELTFDNDWGNGTDPATTLDLSGLTDPENAIAVYWYLDNNITLDSVRFLARADGSATLNIHLLAYTLDVSFNAGDLSSGVVHASGSVSATATNIKTGTLTLDTADINANKIVIGFVENATDTSDLSIALTIKYHVR